MHEVWVWDKPEHPTAVSFLTWGRCMIGCDTAPALPGYKDALSTESYQWQFMKATSICNDNYYYYYYYSICIYIYMYIYIYICVYIYIYMEVAL